MIIDSQGSAPEPGPRIKRKYTVSDRVLAACRANLEHANAVPPGIRYRPTEKRRLACHRNLTLAVIARKRDRSPRYAPCFRNGWYVADPERALPLVGATIEEYREHLEAWRREILPRDAAEEKLAHALGMLSWRWIAGVRLECDLETLKMFRLLQELAAERRPHAAACSGGVLTAAPLLPVTAAQLTDLAYAVHHVLGHRLLIEKPLKEISDRMLRLLQELLARRGERLLELKVVGCFGHRHRVVIEHESHSPYELAGPLESCSRTGAAVSPDPKEVPPVEQWASVPGSAGSRSEVDSQPSTAESQPSTVESPETESDERGAGTSTRGFLHKVRPGDLAMLLEARRLGWELPGSFAGFLRLAEAALGGPGIPGVPPAEWEGRLRQFARAVWTSLRGLRRHAGDLLAYLNGRLGDYTHSLWPEWWRRTFYQLARSAHRLVGALHGEGSGGAFPDPIQSRSEDLADFFYKKRLGFGDRMFRRWERCKTAMAAMCGSG